MVVTAEYIILLDTFVRLNAAEEEDGWGTSPTTNGVDIHEANELQRVSYRNDAFVEDTSRLYKKFSTQSTGVYY